LIHNKVKILFLIDELTIGGTEKQLMLLADSLPTSRFEPVIGVLRETDFSRGLRLSTPIVNFNWAGLPLIKNIDLIGKIKRYIDANNIDILQTQFNESEVYGTLAAKITSVKPIVIATRRNLYQWLKDDPLGFHAGKLLLRWSRAVISNSYSAQAACLRLENVPKEKIIVIPNAVAVEKFNTLSCREARDQCGLNPDDVIIGVVGNWREVKGIDIFLQAAAKVRNAIPAAKFMLVGSGPQEAELRALAENLGITDNVVFWGPTDNAPLVMAAFDIAVQPSRSESFSNVLVEYMAAAKPIVATNVGDAEFILDGGSCGRLVEPGSPEELADAIVALHQNKDTAMAMAMKGRQRVEENWSTVSIIEQYVTLYENLVGSSPLSG